MVSAIQPTIPPFQGNGYAVWSIKMKTFLIYEDLWELVDKGYEEEELPRDERSQVRKNDVKALLFIQQAVDESIFSVISKATKSKEAWDALHTKYQSITKVEEHDDITPMDDSLYKAAARGSIDGLKSIPESEFLVHLSPKHNTILHVASEFGQVECVKWILGFKSGSSLLLQHPNLNGDTPLLLAAREGHLEVVEALMGAAKQLPTDIETGLGVDRAVLRIENKGKNTALHEAVRYQHSHVVEFLVRESPDFSYGANSSGITPLYMAAERRFTDVVKIIIDKSSSPPLYTGFMGRTVLHAAVLCNALELVKTILDWKPDLTKQVDENGWSPLHCAAERGCDISIVKLLLEKSEKSVSYLQTKDGKKTALHLAYFHHHTRIAEEILSRSPGSREQVDGAGNNVLHFAMMRRGDDYYRVSRHLRNEWLNCIGLANEKDAQGNTPLHLLSSYQNGDFSFVADWRIDKKEYNDENLTANDLILQAKEDISGQKENIQMCFELVMPDTRSRGRETLIEKLEKEKAIESRGWGALVEKLNKERPIVSRERGPLIEELVKARAKLSRGWGALIEEKKNERASKENKERIRAELKKQGETHLIVSALITTVTFAAGFTLPGGYRDDGKAILSKKAAFGAFVVTDSIAMVSSLCAVFLHFFMTMGKQEEFLEKHLLWAFVFIMVGMGSMVIAFATGMFVVLPHLSALPYLIFIICACFFICFAIEYRQFWRGWLSMKSILERLASVFFCLIYCNRDYFSLSKNFFGEVG